VLIATRSSKNSACCARNRERAKCPSAFAGSGLRRLQRDFASDAIGLGLGVKMIEAKAGERKPE
jgi:hypothetical protein